jgi:uncharacterized integral membrane protein
VSRPPGEQAGGRSGGCAAAAPRVPGGHNGAVAKRPVHSDPHPAEPEGGKPVDRRRQATLVGVGVAAILLAWFALANLRDVQIDFWVVNRHAPLILVIVISGLLGALIAVLVMRRKPKEPKG